VLQKFGSGELVTKHDHKAVTIGAGKGKEGCMGKKYYIDDFPGTGVLV